MASYYVRSGAAAGGNGTTWTLAYQTLTLAFSGKAAGDIFYVADDHAETAAAAVSFALGTAVSPIQVLCVNRAGSVPPVSADLRTTATVTVTGTFVLTVAGSGYWYGITFAGGTGATTANLVIGSASSANVFVNCKFRALTTSTSSRITTNGMVSWNNVTVEFGAISQSVAPTGFFNWRNTPSAIAGASIPSQLMNPAAGGATAVQMEGLDLSALITSKSILNGLGGVGTTIVVKDCKLGSGAGMVGGGAIAGPANLQLDVINCDSGDTNIRNERYRYEGVETTETTIVRTGGASDGTTTVSRKIVTTANVKWLRPYDAMPLAIWNEVTGSSITLTVECISSAVLNNDDIWMDIEYLGTSGFPLGVFATSGKADALTAGAANTTSTETWGGALTGKFKLVKAITPQEKGWIYVYPKVAKLSTTVYIDPEITVT